jgi:hypothetical protein
MVAERVTMLLETVKVWVCQGIRETGKLTAIANKARSAAVAMATNILPRMARVVAAALA